MALYALASGFLNAYNSSEASKRLSAAKREEIARQIAREDNIDKRNRERQLADLAKEREYDAAEKQKERDYQEEQNRLKNIREDSKLKAATLLASQQETRNANRQRNKVIYNGLASIAQNQENTPLANRALELLGIFTEPYLTDTAFDITSLGDEFLEGFKNITLQIMPQTSSEAGAPIVSFGGGLGAAGNKPGNQGIDPKTYLPGKIIE
tara:strand:- start:500 stop:1129 length:630 start_codon:yes stop_codon:yes gene_type:complete